MEMIDLTLGMALTILSLFYLLQLVSVVKEQYFKPVQLLSYFGLMAIFLFITTFSFIQHLVLISLGASLNAIFCGGIVGYLTYLSVKGRKADNPQNLFNLLKREPLSIAAVNEVIADMPGNVYWMDRDGIFLGCNNNMLKILGLESVDEYIGKSYDDFYESSHIEAIKKNDSYVMENDKTLTIEEFAMPGNLTYLTQKSPLHLNHKEVDGMLGISMNITELKDTKDQLEKALVAAEAANKAKKQFIESMSHDLRTPLSGMIGMAEI
ncbi:MAG: hypothetical protein CMF50_00755, partial [Legionellales bacterium]|nr:hypothetical protein [Legionellales bacterium]